MFKSNLDDQKHGKKKKKKWQEAFGLRLLSQNATNRHVIALELVIKNVNNKSIFYINLHE